jgi:hypothetical protein
MASNVFTKDPDAVLKYKFDWSDWLASGETISTHTITPEAGITVDSSSITDTNTSVTVTLSGGTAGNVYDVACLITTSDSQTDERTIKITCRQR